MSRINVTKQPTSLRIFSINLFFFSLLLLAFLSSGCADDASEEQHSGVAPDSAAADSGAFIDALERRVALTRPVRRVVTLAPNLTEIVYAAGAGHALVGVTTADDYPPAIRSLPRVGTLPIDFEAVTALEPDLVLATDQVNAPRDAETFDALGLPLYFFSFPTLQSVFDGVRRTGALLGTRPAATRAADSLAAAADRLRARTRVAEERPLVLFLIGDDTLYAFGKDSYIHTLIAIAGGRSLTADLDASAPVLSDEFVLEEKPDVIIGAFGADYDPATLRALHPSWDVVPAVQSGRVYSLPPDLVLRPGPRLVEGARRMAQVLHPALFADERENSPPGQEGKRGWWTEAACQLAFHHPAWSLPRTSMRGRPSSRWGGTGRPGGERPDQMYLSHQAEAR